VFPPENSVLGNAQPHFPAGGPITNRSLNFFPACQRIPTDSGDKKSEGRFSFTASATQTLVMSQSVLSELRRPSTTLFCFSVWLLSATGDILSREKRTATTIFSLPRNSFYRFRYYTRKERLRIILQSNSAARDFSKIF
jgi:hypothetical protein